MTVYFVPSTETSTCASASPPTTFVTLPLISAARLVRAVKIRRAQHRKRISLYRSRKAGARTEYILSPGLVVEVGCATQRISTIDGCYTFPSPILGASLESVPPCLNLRCLPRGRV